MHSTPISFHLSRITYVFLGIVAGVFIGTTIKFALGWNPPPAGGPPDPNAAAPINVSATPQYKKGRLGVNSDVAPIYPFEVGGGALIGGDVRITGNATTSGKIHTASTNGADTGRTVVTKDYLLSQSAGRKLCIVSAASPSFTIVDSSWKYAINGAASWTAENCRAYARSNVHTAPDGQWKYVLQCVSDSGTTDSVSSPAYSFSSNGTAITTKPNPNCGW